MKNPISLILLMSGVFLFFNTGCKEDITGEFNVNLPPETFIFVKSGEMDTLNYVQSVQTIYWDGSDRDGYISGFYYTWAETPNDTDWIWTKNQSLTFPLKISGTDTIYQFQIKAVDNLGLEDPTPEVQLFPIKNTAPVINWTVVSRIPDTTFTVASFIWVASDLDGDSTISYFEYQLDDTIDTWHRIPGANRIVSINPDSGLTAGDHIFYLRAVDIAGAKSKTIRMPQNTTWHVKKPKGRFLLIDNFEIESSATGNPDAYYKNMMTDLLVDLGDTSGFDYWNIEELFPAARIQFIETMKLFDYVIWYTDNIKETDESFITAQVAIPEFRNAGGKIIYTVQFSDGFGTQGNPLEFSPAEILGTRYNFLNQNSIYYMDAAFNLAYPGINLPELKLSALVFRLFAFEPKPTSIKMYRYDDPALTNDPLFILLGRNDNTGESDFVFSGTPLHYLNGNNNLDQLFKIIFENIF